LRAHEVLVCKLYTLLLLLLMTIFCISFDEFNFYLSTAILPSSFHLNKERVQSNGGSIRSLFGLVSSLLNVFATQPRILSLVQLLVNKEIFYQFRVYLIKILHQCSFYLSNVHFVKLKRTCTVENVLDPSLIQCLYYFDLCTGPLLGDQQHPIVTNIGLATDNPNYIEDDSNYLLCSDYAASNKRGANGSSEEFNQKRPEYCNVP